jgi:hypothetical protein
MSTRTLARTAAALAVVTANVAGSRVYQGRANTLDGAQFPVVYLYAVREVIETQTMMPSPREQYRRLDLMVDYYDVQTSVTAVIDNQFDTASAAIESALVSDPTLAGTVADCILTNVDYVIDPDEDRRWGCARHTFQIVYITRN